MERLGDWVVLAFHSISNLESLLQDHSLLNTCAVIDASLVCSRLHLAVAIQRLNNNLTNNGGHLRSRNIHSELILMLSPTKNISEAMKLFTCAPHATAAVFAMRKPSREDIARVVESVKGTSLSLADLHQYVNAEALIKVYGVGAPELAHCGLESCVVNRIATCDI